MPTSTAMKPTEGKKVNPVGTANQSFYASTQSRFSRSELIQNLGSGNDGMQFNFSGELRTAYGRD